MKNNDRTNSLFTAATVLLLMLTLIIALFFMQKNVGGKKWIGSIIIFHIGPLLYFLCKKSNILIISLKSRNYALQK